MIDPLSDDLIPLDEAPKHVPARRGKRIHKHTVYRWWLHGRRGHRLKTVKLYGQRYTTREALDDFLRAVSQDQAEGLPSTDRGKRAQARLARSL